MVYSYNELYTRLKEKAMSEVGQEDQSSEGVMLPTDHFTLDNGTVEATSIIRDAHMRYLCAIALPEIGDDYTDEEELEWDNLFSQPHVQAGLDRLAEEAERQFVAGETVEGGFAIE